MSDVRVSEFPALCCTLHNSLMHLQSAVVVFQYRTYVFFVQSACDIFRSIAIKTLEDFVSYMRTYTVSHFVAQSGFVTGWLRRHFEYAYKTK